MKSLLVLVSCIGVAGANYGAPAAGGQYGQTVNGGQYYPDGGYYYESDSDSREDIKRLRQLDGPGIFKAQIKYYHNKHGDYALISCKPNPIPNHITWIMANSKDNIPGFPVNIPGALPLAGGINITYMAKSSHGEKWKGEDYLYSEDRKFTRVGCLHSSDVFVDIQRES